MSALFGIILTLGALFLVGYPLFKGSKGETFVEARPARYSAANEKEAIMSSLVEIEFDYQMKKLSDEDYQSLKKNYSNAAASVDEAENKGEGKSKLKRNFKVYSNADVEQEIEAELAELGDTSSTELERCRRCNTLLKEQGQKHCHSCGERQ